MTQPNPLPYGKRARRVNRGSGHSIYDRGDVPPRDSKSYGSHAFDDPATTLASFITASDVRELVQLLKRRPEGIRLSKVLVEKHKRIFEAKKVTAYETLRIVEKRDQFLRLSRLGWKFAEHLKAETAMFRGMLLNTPEYLKALNWIVDSHGDLVTADDIASFWRDNSEEKETFEDDTRDLFKEAVVTFFHMCQAADLGTMTLGKKGHATRLVVDREEICALTSEHAAARRVLPSDSQHRNDVTDVCDISDGYAFEHCEIDLLINCENSDGLIEQMRSACDLATVTTRVLIRSRRPDLLFSDPEYDAFEWALSAVFVIGATDVEKDSLSGLTRMKESTLCEIGAATFHFGSRLIIITTVDCSFPDNLSRLKVLRLTGSSLTWQVARDLIENVKQFSGAASDNAFADVHTLG